MQRCSPHTSPYDAITELTLHIIVDGKYDLGNDTVFVVFDIVFVPAAGSIK